MNYPHPMDDKTGHEATDEEMGLLRKPSDMERHFAEGQKASPPAPPRVARLHSWGGQCGTHDYEMVDGTIETLTPDEARTRR